MIIELTFFSKHSTLLGVSITQGMVQYPGSEEFSNYLKISFGAVFFTLNFAFKRGN